MIKDRVCQHLQAIGIPHKESARYSSLIQKWCTNSGPEWTVERLKELKVAFKNSLETGVYHIPVGWATRTTRTGNTIVRDGLVHRILTSPNEGKNLIRKEAFLRIYQVIKLDKLSKKQTIKMKSAILSESKADIPILQALKRNLRIRNINPNILVRILDEGGKADTLAQMIGSKSKRSPAYVIPEDDVVPCLNMKSTSRRDVLVAKWIDYFACDERTNELWKQSPTFVAKRLLGKDRYLPPMTYPGLTGVLPAGTLTVIQEGGAKARWVANPFLAFQAIGEPLKVKLWAYTKYCYTDVICTDSQERGISIVADWLSQDRKLWSFDASAFTDRFPLELQVAVLQKLEIKGIVQKEDIEWFKLVVSKTWRCKDVRDDVKWSVGQPLGYGPSFHIATLTHAALVETLCAKLGIKDKPFQIVGDDIVIADHQLANAYAETMTSIGVEINLSKSLISNEYAEFVGKLINAEGSNPSMKVKFLTNHNQIVDTLKFYGVNGLKWLTPLERQQAYRVYLPADLGGYDWRDAGISYKTWLSMTRQESFAVRRLEKQYVDFYGREALSGALAVEEAVKQRFAYYAINDYTLCASEFAQLGYVDELNCLTNIPTAKPSGDVLPLPATSPTYSQFNNWCYIEDTIVRLQLYDNIEGNPQKLLTKCSPIRVKPYGYIHETEKPFNGQSIIQVIHNDRENSDKRKPSSPTRFREVFFKGDNSRKEGEHEKRYRELREGSESFPTGENYYSQFGNQKRFCPKVSRSQATEKKKGTDSSSSQEYQCD